jgi:hypothetical protein
MLIPEIPEEEQTPTLKALLFLLHQLSHQVQDQAREIEKLKVGHCSKQGSNRRRGLAPKISKALVQ